MERIVILCADKKSNYFKVKRAGIELDIYTIDRPAQNYNGNDPVICHPPCAQWSKLRQFANKNAQDISVAHFCVSMVQKNGGILEHPSGSILFDVFDLAPIYSVDQSWWNFPARKRTYLYLNNVKLQPYPIMTKVPDKKVENMNSRMRSRMPLEFCEYLVDSVAKSVFGIDPPDFTKRPTKSEVE